MVLQGWKLVAALVGAAVAGAGALYGGQKLFSGKAAPAPTAPKA
jgi:hypothetical protein